MIILYDSIVILYQKHKFFKNDSIPPYYVTKNTKFSKMTAFPLISIIKEENFKHQKHHNIENLPSDVVGYDFLDGLG